MTTTFEESVKFAGAGWLSRQLDQPLTPFTTKVANVLGQVHNGLYHIDKAVFSRKMLTSKQWHRQAFMSVTLFGQLATFDGDALTVLVLCCRKAGISVEIHGSFRGYTKLLFSNQSSLAEDVMGVSSLGQLTEHWEYPGQLRKMLSRYTRIKKLIDVSGDCLSEWYSTEPIAWLNLQALVAEAHKHAIRVSVMGNSPNSLKVNLSRRMPSDRGSRFERHPSLDFHTKLLESIVDIDYGELED